MPTSAVFCEHANENPARCPCAADCYCKEHTCRSRSEPVDPQNLHRTLGTFPHCDQRVLHKPGDCEYCDMNPVWQALRLAWGINFTGESDPEKAQCPSERRRPAYQVHRWPGNRPTNVPVETRPPTAYDHILRDDPEDEG